MEMVGIVLGLDLVALRQKQDVSESFGTRNEK
jgi:hypothetical protein